VFQSLEDELQVLITPLMRAATVSTVTGKEYASCMNYGCSMYIDTADMTFNRTITGIRSPDNSLGESINIAHMYAPVSGSLVLGTAAGDYECLQHLKAVQHIDNYDPETTKVSLDNSLQLINAYRLFGYDVVMREEDDGTEIIPWAAAKECVIEPSSIEFSTTTSRRYKIVESVARPGRNHVLPNVIHALRSGQITLTIQAPTIKLAVWQYRTRETPAFVRTTKIRKPARFLIKSPLTYNPVTFTARPISKVSRQGFRQETLVVPAQKPEGIAVQDFSQTVIANTERDTSTVGLAE
jgi:hypothetical protein